MNNQVHSWSRPGSFVPPMKMRSAVLVNSSTCVPRLIVIRTLFAASRSKYVGLCACFSAAATISCSKLVASSSRKRGLRELLPSFGMPFLQQSIEDGLCLLQSLYPVNVIERSVQTHIVWLIHHECRQPEPLSLLDHSRQVIEHANDAFSAVEPDQINVLALAPNQVVVLYPVAQQPVPGVRVDRTQLQVRPRGANHHLGSP